MSQAMSQRASNEPGSQQGAREPARSREKPAMIQGVSEVAGGSNESERQQ